MSINTQNDITTIKQAIDSFLLSCKVEGKSHGTIECYADKFKGFLWYTKNYNWPDNIALITDVLTMSKWYEFELTPK